MFGYKLKQYRREHGYSMDKFCEIYNKKYNGKMNKASLSRYENGLQEPLISTVKNLADMMGITVDELAETSQISSENLSQEDMQLLEIIKNMTPEQKQAFLALFQGNS